MTDKLQGEKNMVEEPLGPVELGSEQRVQPESTASSFGQNLSHQENDMDRTGLGPSGEDEDYDVDAFENVVPVEKLKNGAANAMEFINWGVNSLKEQATKVQETESYHKLEEAIQEARQRASSAYEASKPKIQEFTQTISERASEAYETSKPKLEQLRESAMHGIESAKEQIIKTTEACKPTIQRAAESANQGMHTAYSETKNAIEKLSKKEEE